MQTDTRVNAPTDDRIPATLTSLEAALVSRNIDYDQSGFVNRLDADALALDVVEMVGRIYEPFAVKVGIASSANMTQVIDKLDDHSTNDAYVLVGGRSAEVSHFGIARSIPAIALITLRSRSPRISSTRRSPTAPAITRGSTWCRRWPARPPTKPPTPSVWSIC